MVKAFNIIQNDLKELPNNIESEQSVIGSILLNNEIFDEINLLITSKNFYDPMHQKIFAAIEKLIYSFFTPPLTFVLNWTCCAFRKGFMTVVLG